MRRHIKLSELSHLPTPKSDTYAPHLMERARAAQVERNLRWDNTLSLRNGTVLEASREMEKGTLADPFDPGDRWSKYSDCCEGHLDPAKSRELYDWLSRLEDQPNLKFISEALIAAR